MNDITDIRSRRRLATAQDFREAEAAYPTHIKPAAAEVIKPELAQAVADAPIESSVIFAPGARQPRKKPLDFPMIAAVVLGVFAAGSAVKTIWDVVTDPTAKNFAAAPDTAKADSVRHGVAHVEQTGFDQASQKMFKRQAPLEEALVPDGKGHLKPGYIYVLNR